MFIVNVVFIEEESMSGPQILDEETLSSLKLTSSKGGRKGFRMDSSVFFSFSLSLEISVKTIQTPLLSTVRFSSTVKDDLEISAFWSASKMLSWMR